MISIVINKFGDSADTFELVQSEIPVPNDNDVLIRVIATSVNPIDIHLRKGSMPALVPSFPAVLHGDVAGIVEAAGKNVLAFKKGDAVYGWTGGLSGSGGALAEYMLADHLLIAKAPANLTLREAAGVPLVALTAYEAIFERAHVKAGQKVLVYGGAGGVGHMGVQFAKIAGAEVYAVVSKDSDIDTVLALGADHVINRNKQSTEELVHSFTDGAGFDVVFDTVGNENLVNSFQAVKAYGSVVTTIALLETDLTPIHLKAANFSVVFLAIPIAYQLPALRKKFGENLAVIAEWFESGKLKVLIDPKEFGFDDVSAAHEAAETGIKNGKLIISR